MRMVLRPRLIPYKDCMMTLLSQGPWKVKIPKRETTFSCHVRQEALSCFFVLFPVSEGETSRDCLF